MPWAPKWKDSTSRTEVVLGSAGMPLVQSEFIERREEPKPVLFDAMNQRPALPTNGTVARSNVVQFEIDLEPNPTTVARTAIRHEVERGRPGAQPRAPSRASRAW